MKLDVSKIVHSLNSKEINVLIKLYYYQDGVVKGFNEQEEEVLNSLTDKNLITANIESDENIVGLTEYGLSVCGSVMFDRINNNSKLFKQKIQTLPDRAVACFVNRIMLKDATEKENGFSDPITEPYALNENLWYEGVLLNDQRIGNTLEKFYEILEGLGFIENINGQRLCSPEVENFLKKEYKGIMDLTWAEEDSLKYYYFFFVYAKVQKNLLNFSGDKEKYRSMFYTENSNSPGFWSLPIDSDLRTLHDSLGISKNRIIGFLEEMQVKYIVGERYYPMSSFIYINDDEKIFVIKDIKSYMDFIKIQFLTPIVDSLLA
jgi:hypothetical protein